MMVRLIKINNYAVICSDDTISKNDIVYHIPSNTLLDCESFGECNGNKTIINMDFIHRREVLHKECVKVLGHSNNSEMKPINFNGLEKKFGIIDVDKLAMDKLKGKWSHLYMDGYPRKPYPTSYLTDLNNIKIGIYETQALNSDRLYTLKDMKRIVYLHESYDGDGLFSEDVFDDLIKKIPKTEWDIEVEVDDHEIKILNIIEH